MQSKYLPWFKFSAFLLTGLLAGLLWSMAVNNRPSQQKSTSTPPAEPKTIVAAGDISCGPTEAVTEASCRSEDTAALIASLKPDALITLGDNQYPSGALADYQSSYDKTWGKFKDVTYPTPGNHEYATPNASGYFDYFGSRAGEKGKGYYSFSVGDWRFFALNSEIDVSENSPQLSWLKQELQSNENTCSLAYWHQPRFSTGGHASNQAFGPLWKLLYANNVDIVLNGHSHAYERFVPQNPDGQYDPTNGIVQFVSGMGGRVAEPLNDTLPTLATRQNHAFGLLQLSLYPKGARYQFLPTAGAQTFADSGTIKCH